MTRRPLAPTLRRAGMASCGAPCPTLNAALALLLAMAPAHVRAATLARAGEPAPQAPVVATSPAITGAHTAAPAVHAALATQTTAASHAAAAHPASSDTLTFPASPHRALTQGPTRTVRATRAPQAPAQGVRFPHQRHEGLFPSCTVCHRGIPTGQTDEYFPRPTDCANCHNGTVRPKVAWTGPAPWVSNLNFSHPRHMQSVDSAGETLACLGCHRTPGQSGNMAVSRPQPQYCVSCHAHAAPSHTSPQAHCTTCHRPLTRTAFSPARIATLPRPADHQSPDWVLTHAPASPAVAAARCAICHARQSCERCHLNSASVPAIQALQPDPRVAALVRGKAPSYPKPPTHTAGDWLWRHGLTARRVLGVDGHGGAGKAAHAGAAAAHGAAHGAAPDTGAARGAAGGDVARTTATMAAAASCADCHVQSSCRSCHRQGSTPAIQRLPNPGSDSTYGVRVPRRPIHVVGFINDHGAEAASGGSCGACHNRSFCVDCHQGQKAGYHPPNFVEQHGPEAYGNDAQCSACHNTQAFCRTCHLSTGRGTRVRTGTAFHTAQPLWLLNHGDAARHNLEACTACHTQASCAQCHSAAGGWRINPHPPGFDAKRAEQANAASCRRCHVELPQ